MTEGQNVKLSPCPFCGAADPFVERADFSSCYVVCNNCGAKGPSSCDETDADAAASECDDVEPGELPARRLWENRHALAFATPTNESAREVEHPDDAAVDRFAVAMKAKMARAREKGRGGWDNPARCSVDFLRQLFREHVEKGDPVDVANFCMMLHHYGAQISGAPKVDGVAIPANEPSPNFYVRLTDDGKFIRKWDRRPFDGATAYTLAAYTQKRAVEGGIPLVFWDASDPARNITDLANAFERSDGRISVRGWKKLIADLNNALATPPQLVAPSQDEVREWSDGEVLHFLHRYFDPNDKSYGADIRQTVRALRAALSLKGEDREG